MKICLWRYLQNEKNYPGLNLSLDPEGCAYFKERLNDQWPNSSIPLTPPDDLVLSVPNNMNGKARVKAASKLKLLVNISTKDESILIIEDKDTISIAMSNTMKLKLVTAIEDIQNGTGDYSIGSNENSIWFWWWPTS